MLLIVLILNDIVFRIISKRGLPQHVDPGKWIKKPQEVAFCIADISSTKIRGRLTSSIFVIKKLIEIQSSFFDQYKQVYWDDSTM